MIFQDRPWVCVLGGQGVNFSDFSKFVINFNSFFFFQTDEDHPHAFSQTFYVKAEGDSFFILHDIFRLSLHNSVQAIIISTRDLNCHSCDYKTSRVCLNYVISFLNVGRGYILNSVLWITQSNLHPMDDEEKTYWKKC